MTIDGSAGMMEQHDVARDNYDWFQENLPELEKQYGDKYVVIKDKRVIGVYDDKRAAYTDMREKEELGTFIIQLCSTDESKTLNLFYTPWVCFN